MNIGRFLPNNEYLAAVGANAPSAGNVFATIADLSSFVTSNIYSADGSLTGNRILDGLTFDLLFDNMGTFRVNTDNFFVISDVAFTVQQTGTGAATIQNNGTGNINLFIGTGNINIGAIGKNVLINGLTYPKFDGSANYVLKTDGSATLSFVDIATLIPASVNIYNANGSLTGNRIVDVNSNSLSFTNGSVAFTTNTSFTVNSIGTVSITTSGPGGIDLITTGAVRPIDITATGDVTITAADIILADGTQGTIGHVWTQSAITGEGGWAALPTDTNTNIYTNDGSLAGNRLVSMNNFDLRFDITGGFTPLALDNDGVGGCLVGIGIAAPLVGFHVNTATRFSNLTSTPAIGDVLTATSVNGDVDWITPGGFAPWRVGYANDSAESTSTSYTIVSELIFAGTTMLGTPTTIKAILEMTGATNMDCRIFDVTNALVIAEKLGNVVAIATIVDLGTLSNLSAGEAIWEVQVRRTGGTGSSRARIHALQTT